MGSRLATGMLALCACGGAHLGEGNPDSQMKQIDAAIDSRMIDAPPDALPAWSAPVMVPGAAVATQNIDDETLSSTQTEMYFAIVDPTLAVKQLWWMSRASASDNWGTPALMGSTFNIVTATPTQEESPRLSPDDKTIYFGRGGDIYYATRAMVGGAWSTPQILSGVSTANYEKWFAVCNNGYYMVARDSGTGTPVHLYEGQLNAGPDTEATELAGMTGNDISTFLSADCMTTYFASSRVTPTAIYTATRSNPTAKWVDLKMVTDFGTTYEAEDPWISPDGLTFYFASERFGGTNLNKGIYSSSR
jgi:hypothetical protein